MVPGIDPKVDYAFKFLFGRDRNRVLLIALLNAVLNPPLQEEIVDLEILNPFNEKESLDDKLSILDIKARDRKGRQFNVEMQMLADLFWDKRILYYWAKLHQQQLHEGDDYTELRATISICFLNGVLFDQVPEYHLRFRLLDDGCRVVFSEDLELHLIELQKFAAAVDRLTEPLDRWLYFLRNADTLDSEALPAPLQAPVFKRALEELNVLTQSDLERERYEGRLKQQRDVRSLIKGAELRGRAAGLTEGKAEGLAKGEVIGQIHLAQRLLNRTVTPREELTALSAEELSRLAGELEKELRR